MSSVPQICKARLAYYDYMGGTQTVTKNVRCALFSGHSGNHKAQWVAFDGVNRLYEWVTRAENNRHAFRVGLKKGQPKAVRIVETSEVFESVKGCAEYLDTRANNISAVLTGKRPHYKRMTFEYVS